MTKPKKIFIAAIALGVVGYGAYVYRDKITSMWNKNDPQAPYQADFKTNQETNLQTQQLQQQSPSASPVASPGGDEGEKKLEEYLKDCDNKCTARTGDDYKYCLEICGLGSRESNGNGCTEKTGLEKDTCLKNLAIKEKSDQFCEQINDSLIRQSCVNAVAEYILE